MSGASSPAAPAQAAGSGASGYNSAVPWNQIPRFIPGETDVRTYSKKLQFLHGLWPADQLEHLGPRTALLVEGVAFQKISRLDPAKLKTKDGIKLIIEALGGSWGRLEAEEKYNMFEKALYQVNQKQDEANDSYLARHDAAFEDLMGQAVTWEEVRAYVLLRQSILGSDDRKRIILDCGGKLEYDKARQSLRLLGSRFFQDLQSTTKTGRGQKTYDIHHMDEEAIYVQEDEEQDEEIFIQSLVERGDEDACFVSDFEEQIILACQESADLAPCFVTYQEARNRLRDKAKSRGFWPIGKGQPKGKKGKGGHKGSFIPKQRRSLADRIANSTCRICLQPGHWKRECPRLNADQNDSSRKAPETESFTGILHEDFEVLTMAEETNVFAKEVLEILPTGATAYDEDGPFKIHTCFNPQSTQPEVFEDVFLSFHAFSHHLTDRLQTCCRKRDPTSFAVSTAPSLNDHPKKQSETEISVPILIATAEEADDEAIVDTGASRAIIGSERLKRLVKSFPVEVRKKVMKVPTSGVVFKFGNSGRLTSEFAVMLPRSAQKGWLRLEVVPGETPCLISNSILKSLRGVIDTECQTLMFKGSDCVIPLTTVRKNLMAAKVLDLLQSAPHTTHILRAETEHVSDQPQTVEPTSNHREHGIRVSFPKEESMVNEACPVVTYAASEISRDSTTGGIIRDVHVDREHGPIPCLSGSHVDHTNRCLSPQQFEPSRSTRSAAETTRDQHSDGLGLSDNSGRQTCEQDLCGSLRRGSQLREADVEQTRSVVMGEKLSVVLSTEESHQCGTSTTTRTEPTGTADTSNPTSMFQSVDGHASESQSQDDVISKHADRGLHVNHEREGLGQDSSGDSSSSRSPWHQASGQQCAELNGDSAQCRESESASSSNRHPATGIASGDGRSLDKLQEHQVVDVCIAQEKLAHMTKQIEGGLSTLKLDKTYVSSIAPKQGVFGRFCKGKIKKMSSSFPGPVQMLEVYCEHTSQLTSQIQQRGGHALRFTKQDGDLQTKEGQDKLWLWILLHEPRHIWVAPECRLWGNFSRYNMGRSLTSFDTIQSQRCTDKVHLELCNQLYLYQMSKSRHFHLEQPLGSEMIKQPELVDVHMGTLPATFDMCQVGKLKLPRSNDYLRKRTQVFTTSRQVFEALHANLCQRTHDHVPIKGQFKHDGKWERVSAYAQAYTAQFARRMAAVVLRECRFSEKPLILEEMILGLEDHEKPEMAQDSIQQCKRRRVHLKQPETSLYGKAPTWKDIFRNVSPYTPRVGNGLFRESDTATKLIQQLVPDFRVKMVVSCRGTDRHRLQPGYKDGGPVHKYRKTVVVDRRNGQVRDMGPPEEWRKLPRLKQIRSTGPAKMSLTIFGDKDTPDGAVLEAPPPQASGGVPEASINPEEVPNHNMSESSSKSEIDPVATREEGWAPKIVPKSGPAFRGLSREEQTELRRLHNNLGHPDPAKFVRLLTEQGAKPEVVAGAKDMCCDTCVETQTRIKGSQPGRIHDARDFNDVVGADGAYWTNSKGRTFHFMHFIDEATLYHVGALCARKVEDQIEAFLDSWVHWAGPCKTLYLDPAGEYVSAEWSAHLQSEGIRVSMTAAEAHWQNGRAESHGKIVKSMLTRMEKDRVIDTPEEFVKCLRQAMNAKNSLSRVNGFTPEQCLLGKSKALPGSLLSDADASSHALADSDTPEGLRFRDSLMRREVARKAFVQADNDSAFRRALLRQSRPGKIEFQKGDWVLYWRKAKGNSRTETGRWYGPGQVITVESPKVVWVSHLGRLVRASPEQLRPASLREYVMLPKDDQGQVKDEVPRGKGYVELSENPPESDGVLPSPVNESPDSEFSYAPTTPAESQPEGEVFPPDSQVELEDSPVETDGVNPDLPDPDGVAVPVPDSDDDILFGDDLVVEKQSEGVW